VNGTSKTDFEALAEARVREARVLLAAGEFDGAVYLGGYAIECALKAVIAKTIPAQTFPASRKDVDTLFVHELGQLLARAGFLDEMKKNRAVFDKWSVVVTWKETRRYERGTEQKTAEDFCLSLDDPNDGVLTWVKQNW
jgi:HEPN domain-containing protein